MIQLIIIRVETGDEMVSSGTVNGDLSSVSSCIDQFSSCVSGLSGAWQGDSFNNFQSEVSKCCSTFLSALKGQMSSFASACDLYIQYEETKKSLASARSSYNSAKAEDKSKYSSQVSSLQTKLDELKGQIEGLLGSASGSSLASSGNTSVAAAAVSAGGDNTTTTTTGTNTTGSQAMGLGKVSSQLQGLKEGEVNKVYYTGENGRGLLSYIYLPKGATTTSGLSVNVSMGGDGAKADHGGALTAGVGKALNNGAKYSGIVVVLEAENDKSYSDGKYLTTAKELTDNVVATYNADPNKISINGYSYGGFGTVHMLERYPNYFSQAVILAAGAGPVGKESTSKEEGYNKIKTTKVHLICGTSDSNYSGMATLYKNIADGGKVTTNWIKGGTHEINYTGRPITVNGVTYDNYIEFCLAQTK